MKKTILIVFIICSKLAIGQDKMTQEDLGPITLNEDGIFQIENIIEAPNMSSEDIYNKIRLWFGETFRDSRSVLEIDDPVSGTLMGRAWSSYSEPGAIQTPMQLWYNVKVLIKDGRYKLVLDNFDREFAENTQEIYYSEAEKTFTNRVYKKNGEMRKAPKAMRDAIIDVSIWYITSLKESVKKI